MARAGIRVMSAVVWSMISGPLCRAGAAGGAAAAAEDTGGAALSPNTMMQDRASQIARSFDIRVASFKP
ncbi:MAG: hypothetical protein M5R40_14710 [Anaerolineae bacterium]|nr:hypothetical protein [Anaerolineae bacterium]